MRPTGDRMKAFHCNWSGIFCLIIKIKVYIINFMSSAN